MEKENWELFDAEGWILAPKEKKEDFFLRKKFVENREGVFVDRSSGAHYLTKKLYGFQFVKVPVFYDNTSLLPWQGAAFWIYVEDGVSFPVIQMRTNYDKWWFFLYDEQEVLAHELVHAARFAFNEPFFEEILAYRTSKNVFHRFFGPLCIFPWEATVFVFLVLAGSVGFTFYSLAIFFWIPLFFASFLFFRLFFLQILFFLAKKHLEAAGVFKEKTLSLMLRLSDLEIFMAAVTSSCKIREKFLKKKTDRLTKLILRYM